MSNQDLPNRGLDHLRHCRACLTPPFQTFEKKWNDHVPLSGVT